ncbi:MAG: peptidylprolyl isomerase [Tannerella sp.]|jgi:peptidyl-prolyl cis-trans isomerase B (cyclophilin B)|nr:peptidylprolyl isomerase [Tannerella sp.]
MKATKVMMLSIVLLGFSFWIQGQTERTGTKVDILTNKGTITVLLYDETPIHRDNFVKLVKENYYNHIRYHRVINNFLIQVGDPKARRETESEETHYTPEHRTIPAEIIPTAFHRRGVLNAARMGEDQNPYLESSSTQFTIIQGRIHTDASLNSADIRIEGFYRAHLQAMYALELKNSDPELAKEENKDALQARIDTLIAEKMEEVGDSLKIPEAHRAVYKRIGGTPHLDFNYTVFGEVLEGMDVVDAIAAVPVERERPIEEVYIIRMQLHE